MKANINSILLKGTKIQLEPLNESHQQELYDAAQNETIWKFNSANAFGDQFSRWFDKAIQCQQNQQHFPFVVRRLSDNKIIGSTRYYDINAEHHRLTIGYTWYVPEVWGTYVNPECKYLLLKYAFEDLRFNRIEFAVDSRNTRSIAAVKKLGAVKEGVLRHHMILDDGYIRDTVIFSIIKPDWLSIKSFLQTRF